MTPITKNAMLLSSASLGLSTSQTFGKLCQAHIDKFSGGLSRLQKEESCSGRPSSTKTDENVGRCPRYCAFGSPFDSPHTY